jgi:hypothetical protein
MDTMHLNKLRNKGTWNSSTTPQKYKPVVRMSYMYEIPHIGYERTDRLFHKKELSQLT